MKLADLIKPLTSPPAGPVLETAPDETPKKAAAASSGSSPSSPRTRKTPKKPTPVHEVEELINHFAAWLPQDPDLKWTLPETPATEPLPSLELDVEGHVQAFKPVYELKPSQAALRKMVRRGGNPPPLLLTVELTAGLQAQCRELKLAALDLNGRAILRAPGLLVDRAPVTGRSFKHELEPRNIFVGKSARIVRTLLTDRARDWNQRDLSLRTQASAGLISRIVQHLVKQGWLEKARQYDFRLADAPRLLDVWSEADDLWGRTQTMRLATAGRSAMEVAHTLRAWAKSNGVSIAFTQELAVSLRHAGSLPSEFEPRVTAAYVSRLPEPAALEGMDLKPLSTGGDVEDKPREELWLHIPDDEGVFLETQSSFRFVPILQQYLNLDLPLVSDAQLFLDLRQAMAPGPARAAALRNWERFCITA